jgi:hypothetical protein
VSCVGQPAVGGDDDEAFNRNRHCAGYSETVVTTLFTGRELTVGSFASLVIASS